MLHAEKMVFLLLSKNVSAADHACYMVLTPYFSTVGMFKLPIVDPEQSW